MKVKTILVSQPEPKIENSPYFDLQEPMPPRLIHVELPLRFLTKLLTHLELYLIYPLRVPQCEHFVSAAIRPIRRRRSALPWALGPVNDPRYP